MTIQHLLTHTSGLPENEWENFYKGKCTPYTTEEQVRTFRDRPLGFQPGSSWKYRNTEYYLLAFIIEKLFWRVVRNIFGPSYFRTFEDGAFGVCNDGGYRAANGRRIHPRGQLSAPSRIF